MSQDHHHAEDAMDIDADQAEQQGGTAAQMDTALGAEVARAQTALRNMWPSSEAHMHDIVSPQRRQARSQSNKASSSKNTTKQSQQQAGSTNQSTSKSSNAKGQYKSAVKPWMRYNRKAEAGFSLMEELDMNPDIMVILITYMDVASIVNLYAMDKRFHFLLNSNYVAYVRASIRTWAPTAESVFPWKCYKNLCYKDPLNRNKSSWFGKEELATTEYEARRDVPSLRWLQMAVYREGVCKDILIQLALKGLRCPWDTSDAMKRMWFIMDLPINASRLAVIRTSTYIDSRTIARLTCFFIKLDMFFTEASAPVWPGHHENERLFPPEWAELSFLGIEMREYMLAERGLTPLWRVIHGWSPDPFDPRKPLTKLDILRLWVRHKYKIPVRKSMPSQLTSIMGIPWWQVGMQRYERGVLPDPDREPQLLVRPDQLMMAEGVRRGLSLHRSWLSFMAFGLKDHLGRDFPLMSEAEMNRRAMVGRA